MWCYLNIWIEHILRELGDFKRFHSIHGKDKAVFLIYSDRLKHSLHLNFRVSAEDPTKNNISLKGKHFSAKQYNYWNKSTILQL